MEESKGYKFFCYGQKYCPEGRKLGERQNGVDFGNCLQSCNSSLKCQSFAFNGPNKICERYELGCTVHSLENNADWTYYYKNRTGRSAIKHKHTVSH